MKKVLFLQLIALVSLLSACRKEVLTEQTEPTEEYTQTAGDRVGQQLRSITYSISSPQSAYFGYDLKGRMNVVADQEDSAIVSFNRKDSVFIKERRFTENREVFDFKGRIDAKGRVLSGHASVSYNLYLPYEADYTFTYNPDGSMASQTIQRSNGQLIQYLYGYQSGDLIQEQVFRDGQAEFTLDYEFYTNMTDKTGVERTKFYGAHNGLSGKPSKHLIKAIKATSGNGTTMWTRQLVYHLDGNGYPDYADVTSSTWGNYTMYFHY